MLAPARTGLTEAWLPDRHRPQDGPLPFTRERVLRAAFSLLDTPYGWGGTADKRDCSRLMMDIMALFDVRLPRNSWQQGQSGATMIEVGELDEAAKIAAIERASRRAVLLLYMPGHIMLYLGRDGDHLHALSQLSGYLSICDEAAARSARRRRETMNRVNRTTVTSLELGRGSSRRAFIERITRLVLFAAPDAPQSHPAAPTEGH